MTDTKNGDFKGFIEKIEELGHKNAITSITFLSDGRIASSCLDGRIYIYNKDTYERENMIDIFEYIFYITQLSDNNLIACCGSIENNILRIYKINKGFMNYNLIQNLEGHKDWVWKVIEIEKNKLISSSKDNTIKIWEKIDNHYLLFLIASPISRYMGFEKPRNYICKKTIAVSNKNNNMPINIIRANENEIAAYSSEDKYIKFLDIKNDFNEVATINNIISSGDPNSIYVLQNNILLVGGLDSSGLYLIDSKKHEVISVVLNNIKEINSILKLSNENILIGCKDENSKNSIIEYKFSNNDLIKINSKEDAHNNDIYALVELDNGKIASCSADHRIIIWKLIN